MREIRIGDIERINVLVLVIGSILTILIMKDFKHVFSFLVASAIMTLNFRLLRKILEGVFSGGGVSKKELALKLPLKFLILFGLVGLIVRYGDIDPVFFLLGLSTVFISVCITQLGVAMGPASKRRQNNGA
jgi:hypothetical protein